MRGFRWGEKEEMIFLRRPTAGTMSEGDGPAVRWRMNFSMASLNMVSGRVRVLVKRRRS